MWATTLISMARFPGGGVRPKVDNCIMGVPMPVGRSSDLEHDVLEGSGAMSHAAWPPARNRIIKPVCKQLRADLQVMAAAIRQGGCRTPCAAAHA